MEFKKVPLNTGDMVKRLVSLGMNISDVSQAEHVLNHVNYYRLSPYWRIFEVDRLNGDHSFVPNTDFDHVLRYYSFDSELRMLLMAEIDKIEISLRRSWAGHLAINYGPFANQEASLFFKKSDWRLSLTILMRDYDRSQELFAKHYLQTYEDLSLPPIWVCAELMSFGTLSKLISNLANPKDRQEISQPYNLDEVIMISFLHHLVNVRNIVAHHSRIWNRNFVIKFKLPQNRKLGLWNYFNRNSQDTKKIYNTLVMLGYLSAIIDPASVFYKGVVELLGKYPEINPKAMGFPGNWTTMKIWT